MMRRVDDLDSLLVCFNCGATYSIRLNECPECGDKNTELTIEKWRKLKK